MKYTEQDYATFSAARRIADRIFGWIDAHNNTEGNRRLWMEDRRRERANPYYSQTTEGLLLEAYYDMPSRLLTPWGQYGLGGSGSSSGGDFKRFTTALVHELRSAVLVPERWTEMGVFGPVWTIRHFDGEALPEAALKARADFTPYEQVVEIWQAMTERFDIELRSASA